MRECTRKHNKRMQSDVMSDSSPSHYLCAPVMLIDHRPDPLHFPGKVTIMRAGFDTGFNERGPIQRIRPDRRNDDSSAAREGFKGIRIETVGDDRRQ